jgi:ligand-binding sensor protein
MTLPSPEGGAPVAARPAPEADLVRDLQSVLDSASRVGRVSIVAVDEGGRELTEPSGVSGFCREARSRPATFAACERSRRFGLDQALDRMERFAYFCPFGMMKMVVPLRAAGGSRLTVFLGQARCASAPPGLVALAPAPPAAAAMADPVLRAFHDAVPSVDFQEASELAAMLAKTLPSLMARAQPAESPRGEALGAASFILNPAFLVSAVSAIANLAVLESAWKTNRMAILLAGHLKRSAQDGEYRPLSEEIGDVERYLALQSLRYGDQLSYRIDSPPALGGLKVPADALMPAVERAVFCGLASGGDKLEVGVASRRSGSEIVVEVSDNLTSPASPMAELSGLPLKGSSEMGNIAWRLEAARGRLTRLSGRGAGPLLGPCASGGSVCRMRLPVLQLGAQATL